MSEGATNNEMELLACIRGMEIALEHPALQRFQRICIFTDSKYVQTHWNSAAYQWLPARWHTANGRPVENAELWKRLVQIRRNASARIDIRWVQSHSKDIHNRAVDKLAKKSAKGHLQRPIKVSSVRRKQTARSVEVGSITMRGQTLDIRVITDQFMRLQKLYRYKYEVLPGQPDAGFIDLAFSEMCLRAGHHYRVRFNSDQDNPRILETLLELPTT